MPTVAVPSRGIQINFHAFGTGPELVVLVNGFMMTYHGWSAQIDFFTRKHNAARYTVLVFDNRGIGRSSPITGPCNVSTLALDVLALLSDLQWSSFHLVGISMGGMISLEMAARAPSRLKSLMLINTHAGGWGAAPQRVGLQNVIQGMLDPANTSVADRTRFGNAVYANIAARKRLTAAAEQSWMKLKDIPRNLDVGCDLQQIPNSTGPAPGKPLTSFLVMGLGTLSHYMSEVRLQIIRDAQIPTTIVVATDDALVRPSNSHGLYKALAAPWVRLHGFENGGHGIIVEAVDEFNHLLLQHLESVVANQSQAFQWPESVSHTIVTDSVGLIQLTSKL